MNDPAFDPSECFATQDNVARAQNRLECLVNCLRKHGLESIAIQEAARLFTRWSDKFILVHELDPEFDDSLCWTHPPLNRGIGDSLRLATSDMKAASKLLNLMGTPAETAGSLKALHDGLPRLYKHIRDVVLWDFGQEMNQLLDSSETSALTAKPYLYHYDYHGGIMGKQPRAPKPLNPRLARLYETLAARCDFGTALANFKNLNAQFRLFITLRRGYSKLEPVEIWWRRVRAALDGCLRHYLYLGALGGQHVPAESSSLGGQHGSETPSHATIFAVSQKPSKKPFPARFLEGAKNPMFVKPRNPKGPHAPDVPSPLRAALAAKYPEPAEPATPAPDRTIVLDSPRPSEETRPLATSTTAGSPKATVSTESNGVKSSSDEPKEPAKLLPPLPVAAVNGPSTKRPRSASAPQPTDVKRRRKDNGSAH
ncbi:hypothetical protein B0T20DRAFT_498677 [Sordaria brevicollis]|uniref:Uncharacterized protein n=1 Tax=Sordaria brevicollis TaxID=83679 RepID=A0AAE0PF27_SORBR|nr:hypothetical protein B0T20DRAFT_498677 [Sordaria brevicollis]